MFERCPGVEASEEKKPTFHLQESAIPESAPKLEAEELKFSQHQQALKDSRSYYEIFLNESVHSKNCGEGEETEEEGGVVREGQVETDYSVDSI